MRAVDTNVCARYYLWDDPAQGRRAETIPAIGDVFVATIIVLEADALHHAASHACTELLTFDDRRYVRRAARLGLRSPVRLLRN